MEVKNEIEQILPQSREVFLRKGTVLDAQTLLQNFQNLYSKDLYSFPIVFEAAPIIKQNNVVTKDGLIRITSMA